MTPSLILAEARTWLGTRFHHQGRVKGTATHKGGCDCLGLIVGVAAALDLRAKDGSPLATLDRKDYGRSPDGFTLRHTLENALMEVPIAEMQPADILLMRFEEEPQHVGWVGCHPEQREGSQVKQGDSSASPQNDNITIIHSYAAARKVVEHRLDEVWRSRVVSVYRLPARIS